MFGILNSMKSLTQSGPEAPASAGPAPAAATTDPNSTQAAAARTRAQQQASGAVGRSDTILTGPLGQLMESPNSTAAPRKTLLGM